MTSLYDLCVPTILRALQQHIEVLKAGEAWATEKGFDKTELIQSRLTPDMLPLVFQTQSICNTTKNLLVRVGGVAPFTVEDNEKSLDDMYRRVEATIALFKDAKKEKFEAADGTCKVKMGPEEVTFNNLVYVENWAIPNLFFHQVTAYNILRVLGVPVGKKLYLGAETIHDRSIKA